MNQSALCDSCRTSTQSPVDDPEPLGPTPGVALRQSGRGELQSRPAKASWQLLCRSKWMRNVSLRSNRHEITAGLGRGAGGQQCERDLGPQARRRASSVAVRGSREEIRSVRWGG